MKPIRFAQISDTHLRSHAKDAGMLDQVFDKLPDGDAALAGALDELAAQKLDFVLCCGDLVHEGIAEDYARMRAIVDEHLPETPFVVCLGNHDRKAPFYEGYLGESGAADVPYCAVRDIRGLRIVVVDSACSGGESGKFADGEISWLREQLEGAGELGSIVIYHHPATFDPDQFAMRDDAGLAEVLREANVRAVFNGHTHSNDIRHFVGVPQITADSTLFGCAADSEFFAFTDKASYNLLTLDDTGLSLKNVTLNPKPNAAVKIPLKTMMEALAKLG